MFRLETLLGNGGFAHLVLMEDFVGRDVLVGMRGCHGDVGERRRHRQCRPVHLVECVRGLPVLVHHHRAGYAEGR